MIFYIIWIQNKLVYTEIKYTYQWKSMAHNNEVKKYPWHTVSKNIYFPARNDIMSAQAWLVSNIIQIPCQFKTTSTYSKTILSQINLLFLIAHPPLFFEQLTVIEACPNIVTFLPHISTPFITHSIILAFYPILTITINQCWQVTSGLQCLYHLSSNGCNFMLNTYAYLFIFSCSLMSLIKLEFSLH